MDFSLDEHRVIGELKYGELSITGNSEYGYGPSELLVSSVVGCSGGVLKNILEKKRVSYDDIKIKVNISKSEEEVARITNIHIHFILEGNDLDEEKIKSSVELTPQHCPMVQSVKDSIEVKETFELKS